MNEVKQNAKSSGGRFWWKSPEKDVSVYMLFEVVSNSMLKQESAAVGIQPHGLSPEELTSLETEGYCAA